MREHPRRMTTILRPSISEQSLPLTGIKKWRLREIAEPLVFSQWLRTVRGTPVYGRLPFSFDVLFLMGLMVWIDRKCNLLYHRYNKRMECRRG